MSVKRNANIIEFKAQNISIEILSIKLHLAPAFRIHAYSLFLLI